MRGLLLLMTVVWASPALAQPDSRPLLPTTFVEPPLDLGKSSFGLPVTDYRSPVGTLKRSHGLIIGHEIDPNTSIGLGFFKMKPKGDSPSVPFAEKSKKVALGISLRF